MLGLFVTVMVQYKIVNKVSGNLCVYCLWPIQWLNIYNLCNKQKHKKYTHASKNIILICSYNLSCSFRLLGALVWAVVEQQLPCIQKGEKHLNATSTWAVWAWAVDRCMLASIQGPGWQWPCHWPLMGEVGGATPKEPVGIELVAVHIGPLHGKEAWRYPYDHMHSNAMLWGQLTC